MKKDIVVSAFLLSLIVFALGLRIGL